MNIGNYIDDYGSFAKLEGTFEPMRLETKDNIEKTTEEARSQIPCYTQVVNDYQEQLFKQLEKLQMLIKIHKKKS